jgi:hypothetical protein
MMRNRSGAARAPSISAQRSDWIKSFMATRFREVSPIVGSIITQERV